MIPQSAWVRIKWYTTQNETEMEYNINVADAYSHIDRMCESF